MDDSDGSESVTDSNISHNKIGGKYRQAYSERSPKPLPDKRENYWLFQHNGTLAETDNSRNSTGYMKSVSEYKRNYFKQPNVENFVPKLHEHIEKLFTDIKDSAQLPKPQLVRAPYASMSLDSMPLSTKKKLLENYYSSVKKYFMEATSLINLKEQPPNLLKTLEDVYYEKQKITLKSPSCDSQTCDEVESIAKVFYRCNSEIRQISGLQKEISKLVREKEQKQLKLLAEKQEEEINKKINNNVNLLKEGKLRIPYKKDYGFCGHQPEAASHDEVLTGSKYPLFLTMSNLLAEQQK
uniref:Uncharacterized protein n=1 Tax=Rhodnius prolixus TaxID=13249 RepID=T1I6F3_RHOPR